MRCSVLIAVLAVPALADEKEDLKKAAEKLGAAASYHWRMTAKGDHRAGEYVAPDALTLRTALVEIARKGDRAVAKHKTEWVDIKDHPDPTVRDAASRLDAPHKNVKSLIEGMDKIARDGETYASTVTSRALKAFLGPSFPAAVVEAIDWEDSTASVEVVINKDDGHLRKIRVIAKLRVNPLGSKSEIMELDRSLEFFDHGKARLNVPDDVKKKLGLP